MAYRSKPEHPALSALRKLRRVKGEVAWTVIGQGTSAIASLVSVRLLTTLLNPSIYGELALGLTVALLVGITLFGPLTNGIVRFYAPALEAGDIQAYLKATRRLALAATGVVLLGAAIAAGAMFVLGETRWLALVLSYLVLSVLTGYNQILNGIQNAARQRSIVALHQGVESWARFLAAAAFVLCFGPSGTAAVLGYSTGIVVVLTSQFAFFRNILRMPSTAIFDGNWREKIVNYSWPFVTWSAFSWAQMSSDRWALATFGGANAVGLYAVLYQLGTYPIAMASATALQLFAPIFYSRAGDGNDLLRNEHVAKLGRNLTTVVLILTGLAVATAMLFHAEIFNLLVATQYASVSNLLPYALLGSGVTAASQMIELSLISQMKTKSLIAAKIATALLGVLLNFAFADLYGIRGVVAAGVIISAFYHVWMLVLVKRVHIHNKQKT
jgi:O-antigen/teichoic acid export membrane protein